MIKKVRKDNKSFHEKRTLVQTNFSQQNIDSFNRKVKRQKISEKLRFKIYRRDGFLCQYCRKSCPEIELSIDHIIPLAKGGSNESDNLTTACIQCNRGKSDELVIRENISNYSTQTIFIDNPFPQCNTISYKGIMDFLDSDNNIIFRAITVYRPNEKTVKLETIRPPNNEYSVVKLHSEQFKLGIGGIR